MRLNNDWDVGPFRKDSVDEGPHGLVVGQIDKDVVGDNGGGRHGENAGVGGGLCGGERVGGSEGLRKMLGPLYSHCFWQKGSGQEDVVVVEWWMGGRRKRGVVISVLFFFF